MQSPIWMIVFPLALMIGVVLVKWPKVLFGVLAALVLLAVVFAYLAQGERRPATVTVIAPPAGAPAPPSPLPLIVFDDAPGAAPATAPSGKSWGDDWETFVNRSTLPQRWLRAGTTVPFPTEQEARREARAQAAIVLFDYVQSEFRGARPRETVGDRFAGNQWLMSQLEAALMQNQFIADEHIIRDDRPYGPVWSCQVLLDGSPQTVARIVDSFHGAARRRVETAATTWGALAALLVVIVLLYAFLNWVTRGYFVWRLRAAAMMVVIVAILVVKSLAWREVIM